MFFSARVSHATVRDPPLPKLEMSPGSSAMRGPRWRPRSCSDCSLETENAQAVTYECPDDEEALPKPCQLQQVLTVGGAVLGCAEGCLCPQEPQLVGEWGRRSTGAGSPLPALGKALVPVVLEREPLWRRSAWNRNPEVGACCPPRGLQLRRRDDALCGQGRGVRGLNELAVVSAHCRCAGRPAGAPDCRC